MKFDTEKRYYVYAWYIKNTNEVFYIGKGTGNRYKTRKRENSYFMKILNSHECESTIIKDQLNEEEAFKLEKELIAFHRKNSPRLTNVLDGGQNPPKLTGIPKSEEWKKKTSASNKKFYENHPERKKERSERLKEYLRTDKGKEFLEKSLEARRTPEFRELQRQRSIKALNTPEFHRKHSALMKEINNRPEMIARNIGANNHNAHGVMQFDLNGNFIDSYETITEASKKTGCSISKISAVAQGRRKTTGGYFWRYSNNKNNYHKKNRQKKIGNPPCEKAILQYDKDEKFLQEYKSVADATRINGFNNRTNIICNLKGRTKTAYGYIWRYKQGNTVPSQQSSYR